MALSKDSSSKEDAGPSINLAGGNLPQSNPLSRKLNRILESRLEDERETIEALRVLSEFLPSNTLHARRNLRSDIERRGLLLSEEFRDLLGQLASQVNEMQSEVSSMKACCMEMENQLADTKAKTAGLLNETAELKSRGRTLEMKASVVDVFLNKFQLTKEEVAILVGGAVGEELFAVLRRVQSIHEDCKVLLRTSQQRVGLEIMERMAMYLEQGYEKLYHWTQSQCRTMTSDLPLSTNTLKRALQELKDRQILYKYCVDEYVLARRGALVQGFIDALTKGSSNGRPIELVSHDPVRYIGDMLGWLHQAIATEKDHINSLFIEDDSDWIMRLLASITEGAGRPLRMRVEQVLLSTKEPITAYQMVNIVKYYIGVFDLLLGSSAPLMGSVRDLAILQKKLFFNSLTVHTSKLLDEVELPDTRLSPPKKLVEILNTVQRILASRDISISSPEDQKDDFKQILATCIDPMVHYCNESASSLQMTSMAIYLINCLYFIYSTITLYEFTELALEKLNGQIDAHMDTVVTEQAGYMLANVGLSTCYQSIQDGNDAVDEGIISGLRGVRDKLTQLFSAPDSFHLPQLSLITRGKFKEEIHQRSNDLFLSAYHKIYDLIEAKLGNEETVKILPHSPTQAKQLLI